MLLSKRLVGRHAPPMPLDEARFWRVLANETSWDLANGPFFMEFTQLELYETDTGPNLAQGKTAVSSSSFGSHHSAEMAVDGSTSTLWQTAGGASTPQWIYVDLESEVIPSRVVITHRPNLRGRIAKSITVQSSNDASHWIDVAVFATDSDTQTREFNL